MGALLAQAYAANQEPEQAVVEGSRALDIATDIGSTQALRRLGRLDRQLAPWADVPAVANYHDALTAAHSSLPYNAGAATS